MKRVPLVLAVLVLASLAAHGCKEVGESGKGVTDQAVDAAKPEAQAAVKVGEEAGEEAVAAAEDKAKCAHATSAEAKAKCPYAEASAKCPHAEARAKCPHLEAKARCVHATAEERAKCICGSGEARAKCPYAEAKAKCAEAATAAAEEKAMCGPDVASKTLEVSSPAEP